MVAAVPFIDDTVEGNGEWLCENSDLDYEVKEKMILSFFPKEIRKSNGTKLHDEALVMRELFLLYSSMILNQFRQELNPLFLYTYKYNRFLYLYNMDLRQDRDRFTKYCNYMNVRIGRQRKLNSIINNMEEDFVGMLVQFYPTKAVQVKRYLKLAGYGDDEIPLLAADPQKAEALLKEALRRNASNYPAWQALMRRNVRLAEKDKLALLEQFKEAFPGNPTLWEYFMKNELGLDWKKANGYAVYPRLLAQNESWDSVDAYMRNFCALARKDIPDILPELCITTSSFL